MDIVLLILTVLVAIPVVIFTLEVLLALLPQRKMAISDSVARPTIVVLVPAHNESGTIENTLLNINQQLTENDRLLVVADNCSDDTANIARAHGAEVLERVDPDRRGKGYALDYGVRHLEKQPPQVVVIIDADCQLDEGALALLANNAIARNRPVQALYLMHYNNPTIKQRIAEFAWLVKNYVRPRGLHNIGMPCQLMGTGMAFPWQVIARANLATSDIVEDMKMGLDMASVGYAPIFFPNALVTSTFPEVIEAEQGQRKRWEHGHLTMIISVLPTAAMQALKQRSLELLVMAMDLVVPPLALLGLLAGLVCTMSLAYALFTGSNTPFIISAITISIFTSSALLSWLRWGRSVVSFTDLLKVPFYILAKIPLYISYLFKRQKEWIRTDRD